MLTLAIRDVSLDERAPGLRVAFPLHSAVGTASTGAVLIELQPGAELATHRDSAEETLLVLEGAVEAHVDGETGRLAAGELAVVPAMVPHGMRNEGDTVALVFGFFTSSTFIATFDEPRGPDGLQVFAMGAPVPLMASLGEPVAA